MEKRTGRSSEVHADEPAAARSGASAPRTTGRLKDAGNALLGVALPLLILAAWAIVTQGGFVSSLTLPSLPTIANTFVTYLTNGTLGKDLATSLAIVLKGYLWGAGLGLVLGYLMGAYAPVNRFFSLVLNGLRQIPPLGWIPLLILWFGIGDVSKVVLIAMGTFFQVLVNTTSGIQSVPEGYKELARNYHIKRRDVVTRIMLPHALPQIMVGLRMGASTAWMSIVAAEMIAATAGVGYRINAARNLLQPDVVIVYMIVIGVIGGLMDYVLRRIGRRSSRWQEGS